MTFEAPGISSTSRGVTGTLDEIRAFGVDRVRVLVYWRRFAPAPTSRRKPRFDAADPAAYPADNWGPIDRLLNAADARGMKVQVTPTGPVVPWRRVGARARSRTLAPASSAPG